MSEADQVKSEDLFDCWEARHLVSEMLEMLRTGNSPFAEGEIGTLEAHLPFYDEKLNWSCPVCGELAVDPDWPARDVTQHLFWAAKQMG